MKKSRTLIWNLYPPYLLIVSIALAALVFYASTSFKQFYLAQIERQLEAHARLVRTLLAKEPEKSEHEVDAFCKTIGNELDTRITIILSSGRVIGDSEENPANMDNHADRPEIQAALSQEVGVSTRYSYTLEKDMMYVAIPKTRGEEIWGVARASTSVAALHQILDAMYRKMAPGSLCVCLLAGFVSFLIAYRISKPLAEIRQGALCFARGDLQHRLHVSGPQEINTLAEAMNCMAEQLDERINTVMKQRSELESMLSSMVEAVVIVDPDGRIIRSNQAAGTLFGFRVETAEQRHLQEIIRNMDVQRFMRATLASPGPLEDVIVLGVGNEQFLRAHGTLLRTTAGEITGALLIFHNITRLKQLENMRRDFVANVSHELKTPITSISGFVETLQDGAINDSEHAKRFLDIIGRNAKRLSAIIEDLLSLSRIEQEEEKGDIQLNWQPLKPILETAVMVCDKKARDKHITIALLGDDELRANVNADLLEQAVINLLDNAVKYSEASSEVSVLARQSDTEVIIAVKDSGCGISREHLPRLFERFYRVDKARSRKLGGTGLGLAITKHIVHAHHGTISIDSTPGTGSTFSITLPVI